MTDSIGTPPGPLTENRVVTLTPLESAEIYLALKLLRVRIERQNRLNVDYHSWDAAQIKALGERFRNALTEEPE